MRLYGWMDLGFQPGPLIQPQRDVKVLDCRAGGPLPQIVEAGDEAGLIVLGGYRHSRLQQTVLPGVTRTLLRKSKVPLLLSH